MYINHQLFFRIHPFFGLTLNYEGVEKKSRKRLVHSSVIMQNTDNPLMKSNIAIHSMRLAMWQMGRMIGRLKEDKKASPCEIM